MEDIYIIRYRCSLTVNGRNVHSLLVNVPLVISKLDIPTQELYSLLFISL